MALSQKSLSVSTFPGQTNHFMAGACVRLLSQHPRTFYFFRFLRENRGFHAPETERVAAVFVRPAHKYLPSRVSGPVCYWTNSGKTKTDKARHGGVVGNVDALPNAPGRQEGEEEEEGGCRTETVTMRIISLPGMV